MPRAKRKSFKGRDAPSNSDDQIDSRDVIERIDELEGLDEPDDDEKEELKVLKKLAEQGEGSSDWQHGEALIRDSYFEDYARELADDLGLLKDTNAWPLTCIDWEQAARELKQDYMQVDFDGVDYWIRA